MNEPKIPPLPEPHAANESGSTVCTVCWFIETDAGWIGSYNKEALDQLNRRDHQWQEALQAAVKAEGERMFRIGWREAALFGNRDDLRISQNCHLCFLSVFFAQ